MKKVLYVDMDNVLVDFQSGVDKLSRDVVREYEGHLDDVPGIFKNMEPMPGAVDSFKELAVRFDTYVLSTAPWKNPSAWSEKVLWIKHYIGPAAEKRLIITHHKNLNFGDYLIDDRTDRGQDSFKGELILFGSEKFPDWPAVMEYLRGRES
jgi:5'-nucleotidase